MATAPGEYLPKENNVHLNTTYKITLIGKPGVGKTEIVNMFKKLITPEGDESIIQLNERTTHLLDYTPVHGKEMFEKCDLLITTTTPEELETDELKRQEHGEKADAHVIVVDLTDENPLSDIDYIGRVVNSFKSGQKPLLIAANKVEMMYDKKIKAHQSFARCKELHCAYIECSAAAGFRITEIFNDLIEELKRREYPDLVQPPQNPMITSSCFCC